MSTTTIKRKPNPEILLNLVFGYNALLEFFAASVFFFRPQLVYPDNTEKNVFQLSGILANALFCIGKQ